ncbi:hypothetical protein, partial [Streptomyces brasiliscabiei]|uniref:hypothetical protein n=1 Tax=Streptomyces brasiliscabiei TaxID=2736302 RepID=UPI003014A7FB
GSHNVYAVIDAICAIAEDPPDTNNLYGPVQVIVQPPRLPDWEVTGITPVPAEPKARSQFSYNVSIRNHGTAASPAVDVAIYT